MSTNQLVYDKYVRYLLLSSAILVGLMIGVIVIFVGNEGLRTFADVSPWQFFATSKWDPSQDRYGALSFIVGSLGVTIMSIVIAAVLGILCAFFVEKIAPKGVKVLMKPALDLYVAIPSVVYGYLGLIVLVPAVRTIFHVQTGFGIFSAGLVLSVMILPTVISISCDAIKTVPKSLSEASLALGATEWQTMYKVVMPAAAPGILTAIILAMSRAIGETMAVQMLIGNTPLLATSLFTPTATLTSDIVIEMGNTMWGSTWSEALFLMAFILLIISLILILAIRKIGARRAAA